MKIFWVFCTLYGKCFFCLTKEDAQEECDYRKEEGEEYGEWKVIEEDIPDSRFGECRNDDFLSLPEQRECFVGAVRKLRNGTPCEEDDGCCGTCPYFEPPNKNK